VPTTTSLGKLLVELLWDDKGFKAGANRAKATVEQVGNSMTHFADVVQNTVARGFQVATAAAAAFVAATVVTGTSFEAQMKRVQAISGATGADFDLLTAKARQLGKDTLFTATQAGEALEVLAQGGLSVSESLEAVDAALYLAGTSGASIEETAGMVISTMRQFGLEATDSMRIADVMSKAMRSSTLDFSSLREAMKYAGTAGRGFGNSLEETVAVVAAFRDLGLEGSLAGTNLRMALVFAAKGSDTATAALRRYGLTAKDINPELHSFGEILRTIGDAGVGAKDAVDIFGARAGLNVAALGDAIRQGKVDIAGLTEQLINSAGETKIVYDTILDSVKSQSLITLSALQDLLIGTFFTFSDSLRGLLEAIPPLLNTITETVESQGEVVGAAFRQVFDGLRDFIERDGPRMGAQFVRLFEVAGRLAGVLLSILPYLDRIAIGVAAAFAAVKVVQFAMALRALVTGLQAAAVALATTGTAASTATIAFGAVGVAVAAVTAALLLFEQRTIEIERRALAPMTEKLKQYQETSAELEETHIRLSDALRRETHLLESYRREDGRLVENQAEVVAGLEAELDALDKRRISIDNNITGARIAIAADEERAQASKDAAKSAEEEKKALQERLARLQNDLLAQQRGLRDTAEATGEVVDETQRWFDLLRTMGEVAPVVEEVGESFAGMLDPATIGRLRELTDQVDKLVPPEALSRADQLGLLLGELQLELVRLPEGDGSGASLLEEQIERVKDELADLDPSFWERIVDGAGRVADAWVVVGDVVGRLRDVFKETIGILDTLSGGFFKKVTSIAGLVDLAGTGAEDEEGNQQTGGEMADEMIDAAFAFVDGVIERLPDLIQRLAEAIPSLVQRIVDALPVIVNALTDALPAIFDAVIDAIPRIVQTFVDTLPGLVQVIVDKLPDLIVAIVRAIPIILAAIIRSIPSLVMAIVNAIPDIIGALVEGLPTLFNAIFEAIPKIIIAIVSAIPDILVAIVEAIPRIIIALVNALIFELLPRLPDIVMALIGAIISSIPKLTVALLKGIWELIQAIPAQLKQAVVGMTKSFIQGIGNFFKDLITEIKSLGRKKTKTFGDTPGAVRAGTSGMLAAFKPRDYLVAAQSPTEVLRQAVELAAGPGRHPTSGPPAGSQSTSSGGSQQLRVQVVAEGRVLNDTLVVAARRGSAPDVARALRSGRGAKVGFTTGRFAGQSR